MLNAKKFWNACLTRKVPRTHYPKSANGTDYSAADVCVFSSVYEPFGIVCLEAMAMEKPVVVGARGVGLENKY